MRKWFTWMTVVAVLTLGGGAVADATPVAPAQEPDVDNTEDESDKTGLIGLLGLLGLAGLAGLKRRPDNDDQIRRPGPGSSSTQR